MSNPITPELRAKILSAIKDDGISIVEAAKNYNFTEDTIKKWLRGSASSRKKISLARKAMLNHPFWNRSAIARSFRVARSTLYVKPRQPEKDFDFAKKP